MLKFLLPLLLLPIAASGGETAVSPDSKWLAVAHSAQHELVILSTQDQQVVRVFDIAGKDGQPSGIAGVYTDPTRDQFMVVLSDAPEYWLIATDPNAPPVFEGFVHNNENGMTEALASSEGLFARRRIILSLPVSAVEFAPDYRTMTAQRSPGCAVVINLNVNREIALVSDQAGCNQQLR